MPVLSVGNLAVGGTGKTPVVAWLAKRLRAAGHHPGILARGYGPRAFGSELSDEGAVLRLALGEGVPQVERPARVAGGRALLAAHPEVDVLLLDDGFQHRRLARDLDLVLLDATCPWGHGHLLPRGRLREHPRALARAGAVLLTRSERVSEADLEGLAQRVARFTTAPIAWAASEPGPTHVVAALGGARVFACCGIGNPDAFLATLTDLEAQVVGARWLGDHEALAAEAWPGLLAEARGLGAERVVITRKDAVKYATLPPEVTVLDTETRIVRGQAQLWEAVERGVARGQAAGRPLA